MEWMIYKKKIKMIPRGDNNETIDGPGLWPSPLLVVRGERGRDRGCFRWRHSLNGQSCVFQCRSSKMAASACMGEACAATKLAESSTKRPVQVLGISRKKGRRHDYGHKTRTRVYVEKNGLNLTSIVDDGNSTTAMKACQCHGVVTGLFINKCSSSLKISKNDHLDGEIRYENATSLICESSSGINRWANTIFHAISLFCLGDPLLGRTPTVASLSSLFQPTAASGILIYFSSCPILIYTLPAALMLLINLSDIFTIVYRLIDTPFSISPSSSYDSQGSK